MPPRECKRIEVHQPARPAHDDVPSVDASDDRFRTLLLPKGRDKAKADPHPLRRVASGSANAGRFTVDARPGVFRAFGFDGHGFQLAPGVGDVMVAFMVSGRELVPLDHVGVDRFAAHAEAAAAHVSGTVCNRVGPLPGQTLPVTPWRRGRPGPPASGPVSGGSGPRSGRFRRSCSRAAAHSPARPA